MGSTTRLESGLVAAGSPTAQIRDVCVHSTRCMCTLSVHSRRQRQNTGVWSALAQERTCIPPREKLSIPVGEHPTAVLEHPTAVLALRNLNDSKLAQRAHWMCLLSHKRCALSARSGLNSRKSHQVGSSRSIEQKLVGRRQRPLSPCSRAQVRPLRENPQPREAGMKIPSSPKTTMYPTGGNHTRGARGKRLGCNYAAVCFKTWNR